MAGTIQGPIGTIQTIYWIANDVYTTHSKRAHTLLCLCGKRSNEKCETKANNVWANLNKRLLLSATFQFGRLIKLGIQCSIKVLYYLNKYRAVRLDNQTSQHYRHTYIETYFISSELILWCEHKCKCDVSYLLKLDTYKL